MQYKAIGFDYGGVLAGKNGASLGLEISKLLGIDFETYQKTYIKFKYPVNRGEISWSELWELFLDELGMASRLPDVIALDKAFEAGLKHTHPEMLQLVDDLRAKGYKLGLLSNNTAQYAEYFRSQGLDKHFDVLHISAETGFVKPQPEAFKHFCQSLGVQLAEMVFVDDSPKSLSTAEELGYTPILFSDREDLLKRLTELDVLA
jgi:putative hydrolase of the HAD superfamily